MHGRIPHDVPAGSAVYIGVDLGGTYTRAAVGLGDGSMLASCRSATPTNSGATAIIDTIVAVATHACETAGVGEERIAAWGVGTPGPVDYGTGRVVSPPTLPGWDVPVRDLLEQRIGKQVRVGNDANLAAVAEWRYGAGIGAHDLIYVTVSTGVGGGVIAGDHLLLGSRGAAVEIGHMTIDEDGPRCPCGQRGHLEAMASGTAIARVAREHLDAAVETALHRVGSPVTAVDVVQAARNGDPLACRIMRQAGRALGIGLANLVNLFNPEIIIIGGGVAQGWPVLLDVVREAVAERALPLPRTELRIVPAHLGDDAGLIGALAFAAGILESR